MSPKFVLVCDDDVCLSGNTEAEILKRFADEDYDAGQYDLYELKKTYETVNILMEAK